MQKTNLTTEEKVKMLNDLKRGYVDFYPILIRLSNRHSKSGEKDLSHMTESEQVVYNLLLEKASIKPYVIEVNANKKLKAEILKAVSLGVLDVNVFEEYKPFDFWKLKAFDFDKLTENEDNLLLYLFNVYSKLRYKAPEQMIKKIRKDTQITKKAYSVGLINDDGVFHRLKKEIEGNVVYYDFEI